MFKLHLNFKLSFFEQLTFFSQPPVYQILYTYEVYLIIIISYYSALRIMRGNSNLYTFYMLPDTLYHKIN